MVGRIARPRRRFAIEQKKSFICRKLVTVLLLLGLSVSCGAAVAAKELNKPQKCVEKQFSAMRDDLSAFQLLDTNRARYQRAFGHVPPAVALQNLGPHAASVICHDLGRAFPVLKEHWETADTNFRVRLSSKFMKQRGKIVETLRVAAGHILVNFKADAPIRIDVLVGNDRDELESKAGRMGISPAVMSSFRKH